MSKIYDKYLELKKDESNDCVYLFKAGIFYIFIDEDAKKMSELFELKLCNLNETILKCGFPINSLNKYSRLLKENNIDFKIITSELEKVNETSDYLNNVQINEFLKKIKKLDIDNISPKQAYDIIYDIHIALQK